jgi:hypothetical protein
LRCCARFSALDAVLPHKQPAAAGCFYRGGFPIAQAFGSLGTIQKQPEIQSSLKAKQATQSLRRQKSVFRLPKPQTLKTKPCGSLKTPFSIVRPALLAG